VFARPGPHPDRDPGPGDRHADHHLREIAPEILVNSPGASAAVSIAVDLSEGQPDPYAKPEPITPQATTTTTTLRDGEDQNLITSTPASG
jgi:hypothetical protein